MAHRGIVYYHRRVTSLLQPPVSVALIIGLFCPVKSGQLTRVPKGVATIHMQVSLYIVFYGLSLHIQVLPNANISSTLESTGMLTKESLGMKSSLVFRL